MISISQRHLKTSTEYKLSTILVSEALTAGFYIAITRGLAPIMLAVVGISVKEIIALSLCGYLLTFITLKVLDRLKERILSEFKKFLLLVHGSERIFWSILPLVTKLGIWYIFPIYTSALTLGMLSGLLINTLIYGGFDGKTSQKLIARRTSASAASNVIGQIVAITILASLEGFDKYVILFLAAGSIGLIATALLSTIKIHKINLKIGSSNREQRENLGELEASTVGLYLTPLLASMSILATSWSPYLIEVKKAPEYIAASLGFSQMLTSIFASIFWSTRKISSFKCAIIPLTFIPILIPTMRTPVFDPLIASFYAFFATGATLLASFILANLSAKLTPFRASIRLSESASIAQILGLGLALVASTLGYKGIFLISFLFMITASSVALIAIPEVSIVPRDQAIVYARRLYIATTATLGFIIVMTRKVAVLTLRIIALITTVFLVILIYEVLNYLMALP